MTQIRIRSTSFRIRVRRSLTEIMALDTYDTIVSDIPAAGAASNTHEGISLIKLKQCGQVVAHLRAITCTTPLNKFTKCYIALAMHSNSCDSNSVRKQGKSHHTPIEYILLRLHT